MTVVQLSRVARSLTIMKKPCCAYSQIYINTHFSVLVSVPQQPSGFFLQLLALLINNRYILLGETVCLLPRRIETCLIILVHLFLLLTTFHASLKGLGFFSD